MPRQPAHRAAPPAAAAALQLPSVQQGLHLLSLLLLLSSPHATTAQIAAPGEAQLAFGGTAAMQAPLQFAQLAPSPAAVPMPALAPASEAPAEPAAPPAGEPRVWAASPELEFADLGGLEAAGEEAQGGDGGGNSQNDLSPALPADEPGGVVLPEFSFPPASGLPQGPTPGIPEAPSSRARPESGKSTLTSLLVPPPPGAPPLNLSTEQQAALPSFADWRKGTASVSSNRAVGPLDGTTMHCSLGYLSSPDYFAAIPSALYGSGEPCGACLLMACVDSACKDALVQQRLFMIADSCNDCKDDNVVVAARGFGNLTGLNYDVDPMAAVAWKLASCAPIIQGNIKMMPSPENRSNYLALNFSDMKALIRSVTINNLPLARTSFGYWVIDTPEDIPLRPPYDLVLVGANGQRLTKRLSSLRAQDLGIQF